MNSDYSRERLKYSRSAERLADIAKSRISTLRQATSNLLQLELGKEITPEEIERLLRAEGEDRQQAAANDLQNQVPDISSVETGSDINSQPELISRPDQPVESPAFNQTVKSKPGTFSQEEIRQKTILAFNLARSATEPSSLSADDSGKPEEEAA
jgi:hypothetical protein